jgi:predicted protein tyrosine phosphatase
MKRFLFICSRNQLRSPTAEQLFSTHPGLEVASAGTSPDAVTPLSAEAVEWADTIFVMEKSHRSRLTRRFRKHLNGKRVICLDIPDEYDFMAPRLIALLHTKLARFLP